jgi:hypothetical protein
LTYVSRDPATLRQLIDLGRINPDAEKRPDFGLYKIERGHLLKTPDIERLNCVPRSASMVELLRPHGTERSSHE